MNQGNKSDGISHVPFCLFFLKINKTTGFHHMLESLKQTDSFLLVFISQIKDLITVCTNLFFFLYV